MALCFIAKAIKDELKGETINFKAWEKIGRLVIFAASFHCGPKHLNNGSEKNRQSIQLEY